jgi:hypothetical protein
MMESYRETVRHGRAKEIKRGRRLNAVVICRIVRIGCEFHLVNGLILSRVHHREGNRMKRLKLMVEVFLQVRLGKNTTSCFSVALHIQLWNAGGIVSKFLRRAGCDRRLWQKSAPPYPVNNAIL